MPVVLAYRSLAVNELVVSSKTAKALQLQQAAANVKEPAPESTSLASTGKGAATAVTLAETAAETAKTARVASLSQMPPFAAESLTATLKPARRRHPLLIDDGKEHDAKRAKPLPATKLASSSPSPFNTHPRNPTIHFIFGYGSLINPESRLRSLSKSHSPAPAVVVHGLLRSWSYNCRDTYTAVGVTPVPRSAGALTTGVVLRLEKPFSGSSLARRAGGMLRPRCS
ncbi:hypothetical protein DFJ73DRAFT_261831 [Zopfochytrium polystomum]|nr:hypothetical protein DFJ73DRAFT_261831 [Zopfochytrium polystomum]